MAIHIKTRADAGQWRKEGVRYNKVIATAATKAMRHIGRDAKLAAQDAIATAGFSSQWQQSIRTKNYPQSGVAMDPAVYIHSTINYSDIFERGATIVGAPFIWLPLPSVPPMMGTGLVFGGLIRRPHMTPSQYVKLVGPLFTMKRPGKPPMLGAPVKASPKVQPWGKFVRRSKLGRAISRTSRMELIPMFIAVRSVNIPKKFDVTSAIKRAYGHLEQYYYEELTHIQDEGAKD